MSSILQNITEIFKEAPWLNHDLLANLILFGIGIEFISQENLFNEFGGMYSSMKYWADEWVWGLLFIILGEIGILATLINKIFWLRLLGRMGATFGFLTLAGNHLSHRPLPAATIGYLVISLWSLWGLVRTNPHGR